MDIPKTLACPAELIIEGDCRLAAGKLIAARGLKRPLIVSDATMESLGFLQELRSVLEAASLIVASVMIRDDQEPTDVSIAPINQALADHQADVVIALGGGSVIDSSKAAVLLYEHSGTIRDYKFPAPIPSRRVPLYAVPTTAGTGSEATAATVITDDATGEKLLIMGPALVPDAALVDFRLSMTAPRRLTADTGLDALTHAIEAFVSRKATDDTDTVALEAMRELYKSIRRAYERADDVDARASMMRAATLAGIAFSNASVALVHGMSRPIGAKFHVPHGLSNAMLLPAVTAFSLPNAMGRYADCARAMAVAPMEATDEEAAHELVSALQSLGDTLAVPTLKEFGIDRDEFMSSLRSMSEQALASGSPGNNPRVATVDEMSRLYALIYDGAAIEDAMAL
ncbi:iron-containing alcohol dehydrogenase [Congregibacter sp.]|uniref:iron-containing alcohol dehydrogenase n=1 Tax=Congregibacter sp. TaxID=2744308 RepID=UPI00385E0CC5